LSLGRSSGLSLGWSSSLSLGRGSSSLSRCSSLGWSSGSLGRCSSLSRCSSLGWSSGGSWSGDGGLSGLLLSLSSKRFKSLDVGLVFSVRSLNTFELVLSLVSLSSESLRGDQSLDSRSLVIGLVTLNLHWSLDDVSGNIESVNGDFGLGLLADVVRVSWETEELSDLVGSLRTESSRSLNVGESLDFLGTLGDDGEVKASDISVDDGTSNTSSLSLTVSASSETASSWGDEESSSALSEDTVLHWEALLVTTTGDSENISLIVFTKNFLAIELVSDSHVNSDTPLVLVIDLVSLAQSVVSKGYYELHS